VTARPAERSRDRRRDRPRLAARARPWQRRCAHGSPGRPVRLSRRTYHRRCDDRARHADAPPLSSMRRAPTRAWSTSTGSTKRSGRRQPVEDRAELDVDQRHRPRWPPGGPSAPPPAPGADRPHRSRRSAAGRRWHARRRSHSARRSPTSQPLHSVRSGGTTRDVTAAALTPATPILRQGGRVLLRRGLPAAATVLAALLAGCTRSGRRNARPSRCAATTCRLRRRCRPPRPHRRSCPSPIRRTPPSPSSAAPPTPSGRRREPDVGRARPAACRLRRDVAGPGVEQARFLTLAALRWSSGTGPGSSRRRWSISAAAGSVDTGPAGASAGRPRRRERVPHRRDDGGAREGQLVRCGGVPCRAGRRGDHDPRGELRPHRRGGRRHHRPDRLRCRPDARPRPAAGGPRRARRRGCD
jgi:hypothetical protein